MPDARLRRLVSLLDLTTLGSTDTTEDVRRLAARAARPLDGETGLHCAAVCVWPNFAAVACEALAGTPVRVACVAAAFPFSQSPLEAKTVEVACAVAAGAQEIDVAIPRGLFLAGEHELVAAELRAIREACGEATLKVILETCDLPDAEAIRTACRIAVDAGADFLKTSTGMGKHGATLEHARILFEEARAGSERTGRPIGVKPAGGIRTTAEGLEYLAMADEFFGHARPDQFRIGASSLLDDLLEHC
jgi:deoxyribose-phosphate aldolase